MVRLSDPGGPKRTVKRCRVRAVVVLVLQLLRTAPIRIPRLHLLARDCFRAALVDGW